MKFKTLLLINAVVMLVVGFCLLFLTQWTLALYNYEPFEVTLPALAFARYLGGLLLANVVLSWLVREAARLGVQRSLSIYFCLGWAISFVLILIAHLPAIGLAAMLTAVVSLILTLGFGYFWFFETGIIEEGAVVKPG